MTHDLPVIHPKCANENCTHHPDLFFIRPDVPNLFLAKAHIRYDGVAYGPYVQKKIKINGVPNRPNCVILIACTQFTNVTTDRITQCDESRAGHPCNTVIYAVAKSSVKY